MGTIDKTICLDWLQITLSGIIDFDINNTYTRVNSKLTLQNLKRGSKHFKNTVKIIYLGQNVGTFEFTPRNSAIMPMDTIIFKAENELLYEQRFVKVVKEVITGFDLKFKYVKKIDIAIDQEQKGRGLFDFVRGLNNNKIKKVGRAHHHCEYDNDNRLIYFRLGKSESEKMLRAYYKKQEISKSGKQYIMEFWKNSGLDIQKEIERVEICLKKKELERYRVLKFDELEQLESIEFLSSLFQSSAKGFFEFVSQKQLKSTGNITRCKRVFTISFKNFGGKLLDKIKSKVSNEVYRMKQAAKTMHLIFRRTGKQFFEAISQEIANNIDHEQWRDKSRAKWDYEYNLYRKNKRYSYLSDYIEMKTGQIQLIKTNAYV